MDSEIAKLKADEASFRSEIAAYTHRLDSAPRRRALESSRVTTSDARHLRFHSAPLRAGQLKTRGGLVRRAALPDPGPRRRPPAGRPTRLLLLGLAWPPRSAGRGGGGARGAARHVLPCRRRGGELRIVPVPAASRHRDRAGPRRQRLRFCVATVTALVALALVAQTSRTLAGAEDGVVATLARGRS